MRVIECEQGSPEWRQARAGVITASRVNDVMARIKSGEAAVRRNYKAEILVERLTKEPTPDGYMSAEMLRGIEMEPLARAAYEMKQDVMVDRVGFVLHPSLDYLGASPDGLVGDDGLVEIKCPNTATHLGYLLGRVAPSEYHNQMLTQMACCEREWCDFVSYDNRVPERMQLFVVRLYRDDARIEAIEKAVTEFDTEVREMAQNLEKCLAT